TNELDFGRKLYLIENCIFGIDIQPIAVQIAKLRFFISLIVDQTIDEAKENLGILPLPNLETKFVAANTLIGVEKKGQIELNFQNPEINKKEKELAKVRERHFSARTPNTKEKYRRKDENLRNEIAQLLKKDGFASEVTQKLAHWNPYDQNTFADFFDMDWMFGVKDGFDIVIGNPPYLGFHGIKKSIKNDLKKRFFSANGKFDYYIPFIEKSFYLLKEKGVFIFICQTAFIKRDYGTNIRKFLLKHTSIQQLVDFEHKQMFDNVTNYTGVFSFIKLIPQNNKIKYKLDLTDEYSPVSQNSLDDSPWIFLSGEYSKVVEKIQNLKPLGEIANISEGIVTGLNLLYLKKKNEIKENTFENNYFFTCYRGREIDRYFLHDPSELIFYPYQLIGAKTVPIEEDVLNSSCPNYMDYLRQNISLIQKRKYFVKTNKRWYELWNQRKITNFVSPKILTPELSERNRFMIADSNTFYGDTVCGIILKDEFRDDIKLKYLLSILNSLIVEWLYKRTTVPKAGRFFIYKVMFLKNISIPEINISKQNRLIVTADKILAAKKFNNSADTTALEAEIDGRVAHLYNLTEEEYALVLKETNCPDPFRVAALNVYRDITRGKIK
ncbi:MAG: Eco57I restriction-modification methylase domain-containing protein, partial [Deltaproteobacteria bacterium]|nr:Eco57I restriction-modification methylase domain-containing protein [Deltaproteobacteria bacterium]